MTPIFYIPIIVFVVSLFYFKKSEERCYIFDSLLFSFLSFFVIMISFMIIEVISYNFTPDLTIKENIQNSTINGESIFISNSGNIFVIIDSNKEKCYPKIVLGKEETKFYLQEKYIKIKYLRLFYNPIIINGEEYKKIGKEYILEINKIKVE